MKISQFRLLFYFLPAALLLVSCTPAEQRLKDDIAGMEQELFSDTGTMPDSAKANSLIRLYMSFADKYPSDTSSPVYIFRAADLASKSGDVHSAVNIFGKLVKTYPDHRNTPVAVFLQGFIYENQAGDPMKAKPYYEEFLSKYPDHPMAPDVSFSLENLGKSPEELIRSFEKNSTSESDPL
jgi:TolA-binding protein